jgi:hypothetical protein
VNNNLGNKDYLTLVRMWKEEYNTETTKRERKVQINELIFQTLEAENRRFLIFVDSNGKYVELGKCDTKKTIHG